MMKFRVIASSSKGNAYVLYGDDEKILIECGVRIDLIKKAVNYKMNFSAVILTHEHGDHSKSAVKLLGLGVKIHASKGTFEALGIKHHTAIEIKHHEVIKTDEFDIMAFNTQHDAAEPLGFLIYHRRTGEKILFATDTYYIKYRFPKLTQIVIECNYSKEILEANIQAGYISKSREKRIVKSHFEVDNVVEFMRANDLSLVQNVILIHLSDGNSNEDMFIEKIKSACEEQVRGISVVAADTDMEIEFNYLPF